MKSLVTIIVVLLVTVLSGSAAQAHIDTLGTPDPYWQNLASGSSNSRGQIAADATTAVAAVVHPWALRAYLYTMGALLVALAVRGVRRRLPALVLDLGEARTGSEAVRTVEVLSPSAGGETGLVLGAAAVIILGVLLVTILRSADSGPQNGPRAGETLPFQMLFRDAAPPVQRMYREMEEGLVEAENRRAATKLWPAVGALAAEGIPPFALTRPPYRWSLVQDGAFVSYVGMPASDGPAFLALVQEPDPNAIDIAPLALPDEAHHRLADGTLLHVSIWFRAAAAGAPADRPLTEPSAAGWTQYPPWQAGVLKESSKCPSRSFAQFPFTDHVEAVSRSSNGGRLRPDDCHRARTIDVAKRLHGNRGRAR